MGLLNFIKNIINDSPPALSYTEDRRLAQVLKENPGSEEAKKYLIHKWCRLPFMDRLLCPKDIKYFKHLYGTSGEYLISNYYKLSPERRKMWHIYTLNPNHYNKLLEGGIYGDT